MAVVLLDPVDIVRNGAKNNKLIQLNDGTLIEVSYASFTVSRSTDNGQTWTDTYQDTNAGQGLMMFEARNGDVYIGTHKAGQFGYVIRSQDKGLNWSTVLTVESSSTWRMRQDPKTGYLYISEYSTGGQDANELYAYNVWRSINGGGASTWAKWLEYPHQSSPGAKDSIRHVHNFYIDSTGQKYATAGDIASFSGTYVGTMYKINDNGTFGQAVGTFGNGVISICEADDGKLLLGTDLAVSGSHYIWRYDRDTNTTSVVLDTVSQYGTAYSSFIYDIVKGKWGVLYAQANDEGTNKRGAVFASAENGIAGSWHLLDIPGYWGSGVHIHVNPNVTNSRLLVSHASDGYRTIPDFTKRQLLSFVSGNRIRRSVDWYR